MLQRVWNSLNTSERLHQAEMHVYSFFPFLSCSSSVTEEKTLEIQLGKVPAQGNQIYKPSELTRCKV